MFLKDFFQPHLVLLIHPHCQRAKLYHGKFKMVKFLLMQIFRNKFRMRQNLLQVSTLHCFGTCTMITKQ